MNKLGLTNRADMMKVRLESSIYGPKKPEKDSRACGAPEFSIPQSVLEAHLEEGFTIKQISRLLSVSERTIYLRMERYGLTSHNFSNISDDQLDHYISELSFCGEGMLTFLLLEKGIKYKE